jgi:enterochelin esterase family protein
MSKDAAGVWSVTIGPLKPEYYTYEFVVDGVGVLDPRNTFRLRNGASHGSWLQVPGPLTADYGVNSVPHGTLAQVWYPSAAYSFPRRMYVYTPPGYETSKERYPVFYLLHGGGGDEDTWTAIGRAPQIFDNLIAQGKVRPMIVVMPNCNPAQAASPDYMPGLVNAPHSGIGPGGMDGPGMVFVPQSLVADVLPFVDGVYRSIPDGEHRAIAGLSIGGGMTLITAFNHLDQFAWVGTFSAGLPPMPGVSVPIPPPANAAVLRGPDVTRSIDKRKLAALLPQLNADANARLRLFYVAIGAEDGLISAHNAFKELLMEKGVKATIIETHDYGHEWAFWRICLADFASQLFQPRGGADSNARP